MRLCTEKGELGYQTWRAMRNDFLGLFPDILLDGELVRDVVLADERPGLRPGGDRCTGMVRVLVRGEDGRHLVAACGERMLEEVRLGQVEIRLPADARRALTHVWAAEEREWLETHRAAEEQK